MDVTVEPELTSANNINVALDLAKQGFHVFPCHSSGGKPKEKSPLGVYSWTRECTTDAARIQKWWSRYPNAAVGLAPGKSNLIVVDADRHGCKDGVEALGALMAANDYQPHDVPTVATPNEGTHFYYRQKPGEAHGNSSGELPGGIDIRGAGGYIIAPGTVMQDGRIYEAFGNIADAPEIPDWLWNIIRNKRQRSDQRDGADPLVFQTQGDVTTDHRETSLDEMADLLNCIPSDCGYEIWLECLMAVHDETGGSQAGFAIVDQWSAKGDKYPGARNLQKKWGSFKKSGTTRATLAKHARDHGGDPSRIAIRHMPKAEPGDLAESAAAAKAIQENILKRRVTEAVNDIETDEENQGGAIEFFDLPEGMLNPGGVVGEIADWICDWTSEPIRIHAIGAALVIVGNLVARKVYSRTRPTGTALYVGITAPSGMGKQHPQDAMRLALDQATSICAHTGWNVSLPSIIRALSNKAATVMIADEFADKLIGIRGRNANASQLSISEGLRTLWGSTAGTYSPDAALSRQDTTIQKPCLSFFGASTQKDFARSLVSRDITNGLFNRFLILPRFGEVRTTVEPDGLMELPEILKNKLLWLYNCLNDQFQTRLAERADSLPAEPVLVPFTDDAKAMDEANKAHQKAMQRASEDDEALALYGRYAEQIKRVALIVACGRQPEDLKSVSITEQDMNFARTLVEYSIQQFVLMVRRDMVENRIEADRKNVLGVIRKKKEITRSALLRCIQSISARDMRDILGLLCEANQIVEIREANKTKPITSYRYIQG